MSEEIQQVVSYSRRRRHFRGYRRVKVILLALGLTGLIIGLGLIGAYLMRGNAAFVKIGTVYVLVSLILLGFRGIMIYLKHSKSNMIR